jgi:heme/copper-type cytochrome/quinol oxidase subunit 4
MGHHENHTEVSHSSYKSYLIGFVLSVILTAIPFGLVMTEACAYSLRPRYRLLCIYITSYTWIHRQGNARQSCLSCLP